MHDCEKGRGDHVAPPFSFRRSGGSGPAAAKAEAGPDAVTLDVAEVAPGRQQRAAAGAAAEPGLEPTPSAAALTPYRVGQQATGNEGRTVISELVEQLGVDEWGPFAVPADANADAVKEIRFRVS